MARFGPAELMTRAYTHYSLTEAEEREIVRLYRECQSAVKVSEKTGVKIDKVYQVLDEHGVRRNVTSTGYSKVDPAVERELLARYKPSEPVEGLAKELGLANSTAIYLLTKHGVYARKSKAYRTIADLAEKKVICAQYKSGMTVRNVAALHDVSTSQITRVLREGRVHLRRGAYGRYPKVVFKDRLGRTHKLRSPYEIEFAKLLDRVMAHWDYETMRLKLDGRRCYWPDFVIYTDSVIDYIVEIKGDRYCAKVSGRLGKVNEARRRYPHLKIVVLFKQDVEAVQRVVSARQLKSSLEGK